MQMSEWKNRKITRLPGYDYSTPGTYFLTICTLNRKCLLSRVVGTGVLDGPKIDLLPYGKTAAKYINQMSDFYDHLSVDSFVIMPNHIHILLSVREKGPSGRPVPTEGAELLEGPSRRPVPTEGAELLKGPSGRPVPTVQNSEVSRFVSTFKRLCNKEYGRNIWQRGAYDHVIRGQRDFDWHLKYIYENPFDWTKDDLYSEE